MNKEDVVLIIEFWEKRLAALYAQIEDWFQLLPPNPIKELHAGSMLQHDEALMREFDVVPRMLPTLAIVYGKNRVTFAPGAIWTRDSNGFVNVTTSTHVFHLLDLGGTETLGNWHIIRKFMQRDYRPFDRQIFENLVLNQAIEAA